MHIDAEVFEVVLVEVVPDKVEGGCKYTDTHLNDKDVKDLVLHLNF